MSSIRNLWRLLAAACLAAAVAGPAFAQPVTLERDAPLYAEARFESGVVATLKQGSAAEAVGKSGAWLNLKTPEGTGWLLSFNVRYATARTDTSAAQSGAGVGRLFGPRQRVSVTSTIGIRGLDAEDLTQARFDGGQMSRLDEYAASRQDAEARAASAGLAVTRVDYLEAGAQ